MNLSQFQTVFPLGSHLCREPMPPMAELKRDMENLRRHGFNLVKLQEHWMSDEPAEGRYDFSRYEELICHAARLEMAVYLGLTCEQAPNWLWRKHPDCRMVGRDGRPLSYQAQMTLPADGKPGPCFDHPGAMEDQQRFIRKLVSVLGRYENLVVWNTWQEIGYWSEALAGQPVCYCTHTIRSFQEWLQERFGDLECLNRAWNTRYASWQDVLPNRMARFHPLPQTIWWRYFMENVQIARILQARCRTIKEADLLKRPVFAHRGAPDIGSGVDWTYARCQDFLGSSTYPAWSPPHPWDDDAHPAGSVLDRRTALLREVCDGIVGRFDYIRSCNRPGSPVWAAEFQGGPVSTGFHKGRVPSPDDIRRWMLSAVASGVTGISFWVTRAEISMAEANGFSLLDSEGDTTERFEEASRIGKSLNRHPELFGKPSWPSAEAAVLVSETNYRTCISMQQGGDNLAYSVRGWHRMLWEQAIPLHFLGLSHFDEKQAVRYRAIVFPFPLCLSEQDALKLVRYVEQGGNLICEAAPGRYDENGYCNRGELSPVMRTLFGVSQKSFVMVREPGNSRRWSPPERTWGEYLGETMLEGCGPLEGKRVRPNVYVETFACEKSVPILRYGQETAGTVRGFGKGRAWLLGTYVGHNGTAYRDDETRAFLLHLLGECGMKPSRCGKLLLRKRAVDGKEAWFLTNPTPEKVEERVDIRGWEAVEDLLGEPLHRQGADVTITVGPLDVKVLALTK